MAGRMRFLICGLGSIGRRHLRNLISLGQEDIVLLRTGKSTLPDDDLAGFPVEQDLERALERWSPEAVIVSNPTALHLQVALPSAQSGCHLLLEKPVSHTMEGVDELWKVLRSEKRQALVGYQFRFHPGLRKVKSLLSEGAIGRVLSARVNWGEYLPSWHPWEDYRQSYSARKDLGGGVVLTLSHPLDYLRWLFGEISAVSAQVGTSGELDLEVEDNADLLLELEGGVQAIVHLDYLQRPPCHNLEIVGCEGTIRWDNYSDGIRWWSAELDEWVTYSGPEGFDRNSLFLDEMRHFLDIVEGEASPICTLEDGIRVLEVSMAAQLSSSDGCRVDLRHSPLRPTS